MMCETMLSKITRTPYVRLEREDAYETRQYYLTCYDGENKVQVVLNAEKMNELYEEMGEIVETE